MKKILISVLPFFLVITLFTAIGLSAYSIGVNVERNKRFVDSMIADKNNGTLPNINVTYNMKITDMSGRVISQSKENQSHSYVRAMVDLIWSAFANTSLTSQELNWGSTTEPIAYSSVYSVLGTAADVGKGIIIGSSTSTPDISDYKIGTIIATGTSSGQMAYQACTVGVLQTVGQVRSFTVTRQFNNGSGASITVNEIAVYMGTSAATQFCLIHDTIAGGQAVANSHNLTIQYTISVTP